MLSKNEKGFFMADMLLSLTAFLMATTVLLPIAVVIIEKTAEVRAEEDANSILYDELMYLKVAGTTSGTNWISQNGIPYEVTVTKVENNSTWEVCVHYESNQQAHKKCSATE
ncbi:hypothetical protein [Mesobacillus subterraneus]|uniref:Type II secretion system protein n=2 Tax=Mesobacillus TaxID=2675231 RepID=A0A0D6Z986_9BACI|nr:hypothetical protein [Mesobacillus subterraneus]KIY21148.1 hypothetical protein UB32_15370 [Mesobacillus subterraneus]